MESLSGLTSSKIVIDKYRVTGLGGYNAGRYQSRISYSNCSGRVVMGFNFPTLLKCRTFFPILPHISATSHSQVSETAVDGENELRTARVRFQLQKACGFGDHFLMVGDDPVFGSWDPEAAIKMEWSDGHIWTAEVDIPVEKTIQYKFILKQSMGDIIWQPGPDRIFKTWTASKTVTVVEDWENSQLQKIVEDGELLQENDVKCLDEIQQAENSVLDVVGNGSILEDLSSKTSKINMMVAQDFVSDQRRMMPTEGLEDEEVIIADPVLVPGLGPSMSNMSIDGSPSVSKDLNGSIRSQDDQASMESCSNSKAESGDMKHQLLEEVLSNLFSRQETLRTERQEPDSGLKQERLKFELEKDQKPEVKAKREETKMKFSEEIEFGNSYLNGVESQINAAIQDTYHFLKNGMHWVRKTLQNLLSGFEL